MVANAVDPRDLARIRTEARLAELAVAGLLSAARPGGDLEGADPVVLLSLAQAGMALEEAQEKLREAIENTPGGRA